MGQKVREAFAKELSKAETEINLAYAALLFAEYLTGPFDMSYYMSLLDGMAETIWSVIKDASTEEQVLETFNNYMFGEFKFMGNSQNYYDVNNSFLYKVLETKAGIPISLSAIYLEVGWRLGLPLWGVGMPRHFIVGYGELSKPIYIDVFNQGWLLNEDDCLTMCQVSPANREAFRAEFLQPATKKAILYRMLLNLKHIYIGREIWEQAYKTVDLMRLVDPRQLNDLKDKGLLAYRTEKLHEAIFDLNRYLFLAPQNGESEWLAERVKVMEKKLMRLN
jgi:regulator of sirC expression with transglutaminase-like and TPR domain